VVALHLRHLFCLRHVLKSLHTDDCGLFAFLMGNLISPRREKELRVLRRISTPDFTTVRAEDGNEETKLRRCLKKVGLLFVNGEIIDMDQEHKRWNHMSMLARVGTKIPSTSNTIKSLNSRLNEKTPRFNTFYRSLHQLREAIMQKIENFTDCTRHNHKYRVVQKSVRCPSISTDNLLAWSNLLSNDALYEGRRAQRRFISVSWARMDCEIAFFLSTDDVCLCGETVLTTVMHRVDCPCSHRFGAYCGNRRGVDRLGSARNPRSPPVPRLPRVVLRVILDWTQCEFRLVVVDRVVFAPTNPFHQGEVQQLVKLIARDAHVQTRRDEVRFC
jgi:hypothetical protein